MPERLDRSILAVPASEPEKVKKAVASAADAVFLDLEDAVPPDQKDAARGEAARALQELDWGSKTRMVRINGLDTPWAYRDLVEVCEVAAASLDCVVVPKVGRPEEVAFVDILLGQVEARLGLAHRIRIHALVESAQGLANVDRIAAASPRLEALSFGPGDFAASVGMPASAIGTHDAWDDLYPGHRWHYAMQRVLVAARAHGLRAYDGPSAEFRDLGAFRRLCLVARALGFDGKWCIHPAQIPVVHEVFSPTPEEVAWARRVVAAYEAAQAEGRGAITVDGKMVDAASLRMAHATLARSRDR
ncbi:L-malyl-CoA/beta-methylmalyl-CoA lyase [bacterium HR32]|jgi:citrate lyase subunit beta/citryl-CoA lyase|nr:L-malyl-CoA/beta-methylmalyl-CoA lyase [bacterium HR32]